MYPDDGGGGDGAGAIVAVLVTFIAGLCLVGYFING